MSFAIGLLGGVAGGLERKRAQEARARELSVMELAGQRQAQGYSGRSGGYDLTASTSGSGGFDPSRLDPSIRTGIMEAADELQMDPADMATIISYETAGTFDPRKRGPRTQWGQHEGLIQFGEPQAKEYGVDWSNPVGSQLGRKGAIVRYFRKNGWQPGMGMLDAYSIVNAGAPGRYNASDAGNGGAAGTVRDKVESQMSGHRAKALALLGHGQSAAPAPEMAQPSNWGWFQNKMNGGGK